jgi:16S rRNA (uracil1498-N3)-methyltransferase
MHQSFELPNDLFHHAVNVLRLREHHEITIFDGIGNQARAQLTQIEKKSALATITLIESTSIESPLSITLAQCLSVGDKMDWTIEKAVELGVTRITPLFSVKSQIKLTPERAAKKLEHWQRIIIAACAQCGRNVLPQMDTPQTLNTFLGTQKSRPSIKLMLHPNGAIPFKAIPAPQASQEIILLIGPEGGFDDKELAQAQASNFTNTVLGPRVLRTESAGLAAIAALQTIWGDF